MRSTVSWQRLPRRRSGSVFSAWALAALLSAPAGAAQSPAKLAVAISPQPLAGALTNFAKQTHLQLLYVSELARGKTSKGAPAGVEVDVALTRLLEGTGLRFEFLNERSVRIFAAPPAAAPVPQQDDHQSNELRDTLEEVVVTATQRDELQSLVPISMAAWTAEAIEMSGAKYFGALANLTPGVEFDSFPDFSAGIETNIAIRGINSKDGSTTAVYIDDTPIPMDPGSSFGRAYPFLFDLKRIEVLRGPQGVLYGEGAQGGAVRFITVPPDMTTLNGFAKGEVAATARSAPSYEASAAGSVPLGQGFAAVRLGAWWRQDGGFVDRVDPVTVATVEANSNHARSEAVNAAITISPNSAWQITPSFRYQSLDVNDTSAFFLEFSNPSHGVLRNGSGLPQYYTDHFTMFSLKIGATFEAADLSSTSAYFRRDANALEYNAALANTDPAANAAPVWLQQTVLSEELRLASRDHGARLRWIVGASYVHAHYDEDQDIANSALADGGALNGRQVVDRTRSQLGVYGELDLQLWPRWTARLGLRAEHDTYDSQQQVAPFPPLIGEQNFAIDNGSTSVVPQFNLSYQTNADSLYYATISEGYRMGGPNNTVGLACPVSTPLSYGPDYIWSYELGSKQNLRDSRLQLDAAVFYMSWQAMQLPIPLTNCGFSFTVNAGAATSKGFDLGLQAAVSEHLKLAVTVAYTDARYDETVTLNNQVVVSRGDVVGALPLVAAPWTVSGTASYEMAIKGARLTVSAQDMYASSNPGPFSTDNPLAVTYAPLRRANPSTNVLNVRAAATWHQFELALFVNNVFDSQPTLQVRNHITTSDLLYATTFRPRTIGLSGGVRF